MCLQADMSEVFEGYERQYCELSANLSRKCTSAALLDGGIAFYAPSLFVLLMHQLDCVFVCKLIFQLNMNHFLDNSIMILLSLCYLFAVCAV